MDAGGVAGGARQTEPVADLDERSLPNVRIDGGQMGIPRDPGCAVVPVVADADVVAIPCVDAGANAVDHAALGGQNVHRPPIFKRPQVDALMQTVGVGTRRIEGVGDQELAVNRIGQEEWRGRFELSRAMVTVPQETAQ